MMKNSYAGFLFALATATIMLGMPTVAWADTLYECRVRESGKSSGYIPQTLVLTVKSSGVALAFDPVIKHFLGAPVKASLRKGTNRLSFSWSVRVQDSTNKTATMLYRASLDLKSRAVRVSARPAGYENNFTGKGRCAKRG